MPSDYDDIKGIDYSQLRKHKRYDLCLACIVKPIENENKVFNSLLTSISAGGVSLINQELLEKGKFYIVSFKMPNGSFVTKKIEIRWFETDVLEIAHENKVYKGFEHGCKFIVVPASAERAVSGASSVSEPQNNTNEKASEKSQEDTLEDCFYHIEFLRDGGANLRHGYVNKLGAKSLCFYTLTPLRQNEIIDSNLVKINENELLEQREKLLVREINKDGRQYLVKATILN